MPSIQDVIEIAIGFVLAAIVTPVSMAYLASINSTFNVTGTAATWAPVFTIFSILIPVLYMIGVGLYFIPKWRSGQ